MIINKCAQISECSSEYCWRFFGFDNLSGKWFSMKFDCFQEFGAFLVFLFTRCLCWPFFVSFPWWNQMNELIFGSKQESADAFILLSNHSSENFPFHIARCGSFLTGKEHIMWLFLVFFLSEKFHIKHSQPIRTNLNELTTITTVGGW